MKQSSTLILNALSNEHSCKQLQLLNLSHCSLSDDSNTAFETFLNRATALKTLLLRHNRLAMKTCWAIGKALQESSQLNCLDLSGNDNKI